MVYRKGELSKGTIDREWPHQVAVPADGEFIDASVTASDATSVAPLESPISNVICFTDVPPSFR